MDIPELVYKPTVRAALPEDIGPGDITTLACIPAGTTATATVLAKSPGVIAGLDVAALAFRLLDPDVRWQPRVRDGAQIGNKPTPIAAFRAMPAPCSPPSALP